MDAYRIVRDYCGRVVEIGYVNPAEPPDPTIGGYSIDLDTGELDHSESEHTAEYHVVAWMLDREIDEVIALWGENFV